MGEWTVWEKILFRIKQMLCSHKSLTGMKFNKSSDVIIYEITCQKCGKLICYIELDSESE
jgi:hypothetical protein